MPITLNIYGKQHSVDVDPNTPLLWVIREQVGLTGTKYGCGVAQCGSCTVMVEGQAVRSCSYPVSAVGAQKIQTVIKNLKFSESLSRSSFPWSIPGIWRNLFHYW